MLGAIRENREPRESVQASELLRSSCSTPQLAIHAFNEVVRPRASGDTSATQVPALLSRGGLVQPFVLFKEMDEGTRARIHRVLANFNP